MDPILKLTVPLVSAIVALLSITIGWITIRWNVDDFDMESFNKIKGELRFPEIDDILRSLVKDMYGNRAGDPKFIFLVDQTKLLRAENQMCNLRGKSSQKRTEANIYFFALDKPSYETMKDLWVQERIIYFPFDKQLTKARKLNIEIDWVIRAVLTERLTRWYGDVYGVFGVETAWFQDPYSLGVYLKRRKDSWDLVTNTIGYWGPLENTPLYSMYFINPSPNMRQFMEKLVETIFATGKRDRVIIGELCGERFHGIQCNWTNQAQNMRPTVFVTSPAYRRKHLGMNLDYTVWHHYFPDKKEFEMERLKKYELYYLEDGPEGRTCNVTSARKRKTVPNLWKYPVDLRLWYIYTFHSWLQYILPVSYY